MNISRHKNLAFTDACTFGTKSHPSRRCTSPKGVKRPGVLRSRILLNVQSSDTSADKVRTPQVGVHGKAQQDCKALVLSLWKIYDSGNFSDAADLFKEDAKYFDTLYSKPFVGKENILRHLKSMEKAFARNLRYIVDDIAASEMSAGVRWHITLENGKPIPFTRGASTYKAERVGDTNQLLLTEAWDFPEPSLKVAWLLLPVLSLAIKLLQRWPQLLPDSIET